MEAVNVSIQEVRVYLYLKTNPEWLNAATIADGVKVSPRTARRHLKTLAELGIAELVEAFPSFRYRIAPATARQSKPYRQRLEQAAVSLGELKG